MWPSISVDFLSKTTQQPQTTLSALMAARLMNDQSLQSRSDLLAARPRGASESAEPGASRRYLRSIRVGQRVEKERSFKWECMSILVALHGIFLNKLEAWRRFKIGVDVIKDKIGMCSKRIRKEALTKMKPSMKYEVCILKHTWTESTSSNSEKTQLRRYRARGEQIAMAGVGGTAGESLAEVLFFLSAVG